MRMSVHFAGLLAACLSVSIVPASWAANLSIPASSQHFAATAVPDRVVVVPGADPATSFSVAWRTDAKITAPRLQLVVAKDSPDLADAAAVRTAHTQVLSDSNGLAHHHTVRLTGLQPATLYAYRVEGTHAWSEWFQVRTAAASAQPFSFLYFGDAQNSVKSLYSRVIREAWRREPTAALMIHAGDLISGRDNRDDDEWGEWFHAGGFLHASTMVAPAAGNHEHKELDDGRYQLYSSFGKHFPVPGNGLAELAHTTYYFDYQGVRFITLDSTSALENDTVRAQAKWLEDILQDNPNRWTVVTYHHPMISGSLGRDNPPLRKYWQPLFERFGVDLVLQGHDHVYGRTDAAKTQGPVYVVSVAGPKQYRVSPAAAQVMVRTAENRQLYQVVHVDTDTLRYEARTVTGQLYDAFTIHKDRAGGKRLSSASQALGEASHCPHAQTRSGRRDRCWDGTEW